MTEYNEGDLVRATKGDTVIQGPIAKMYGWIGNTMYSPKGLIASGFTVEVVEKAPDPKGVHEIALGNAPRKSFVRGDTSQRVFFKGWDGKWYEIHSGWGGDAVPTFTPASEETMKMVAGWLDTPALGMELYPTEGD